MPTRRRVATIDDLLHQMTKFIGVAMAVLERYADLAEEVRAIRVTQLSDQGVTRDYFEESGLRDHELGKKIERLERLEILDRTGGGFGIEANQIRKEIKGELLESALRQELSQQLKNLEYARLKAARFGVNVPTDVINEISVYEEAITRIREELNSKAE